MANWQPLAAGQALTRWAMSAAVEQDFPGQARPMPDTVDYRFANGWVATGDLPCREALRSALPGRKLPCPSGPFDNLAIALDGRELDFSVFRHRPTLIDRSFACMIRGNKGKARMQITTCGGVRLWLDGEPIARFEPFVRNRPAETEIELTLSGAEQTLVLRLEDLHERDTTCFFSLTLLEGTGVTTALPAGFSEMSRVEHTGRVLASLRTDRIFYDETQDIRLVADVAPTEPLSIRILDLGPFGRGGIMSDPNAANTVEVTLTPQQPEVVLAPAHDLPAGCLSLRVETHVDGAGLSRQLGTTVLKQGEALTGDWSARQARVRDLIARTGGFEPAVALCCAAANDRPEHLARVVSASLDTIEQRFDCSDFTILPLLRLFRDHPDSLPIALQERMRDVFSGYRFWLDEPGNDVMWFWSENHVLCFHTAQLVAGQLMPDTMFRASGRSGAEQAALATIRLNRWFEAIERDGLCEWNSAAYYPIDLLGLLTLHDMAPAFRPRAARLIDRILVMATLHSTGTVPAGTQGRCYEKELLAGPHTELGSVMALVLGRPYTAGYDRAAGLLALSSYQPPPGLAPLATPATDRCLQARYVQGHGADGRLTLWKSAHAQLSTVRPHAPGTHGHQAQMLDVQIDKHPMARLWINHPGEARVWGERRPSLLAGSHVVPAVAQSGPYGLMVFDLQKDWTDLKFTQLFAPPEAFGAAVQVAGWHVFAETVAVWCSVALRLETTGLYRGALWRAHADQMGWCLALRRPGEDGGAFVERLNKLEPTFQDGTLELRTHTKDLLSLGSDGTFCIDNRPNAFEPAKVVPHLAWDDAPLTSWEDWNERSCAGRRPTEPRFRAAQRHRRRRSGGPG